jgi:hypothetical protein
MIAELKKTAVPVLRELGFKGSFPHFRRIGLERVDVLTFQFSSGGGSFVVEIGACPPHGFESCGKLIPPQKVKVMHLYRRMRLGAKDEQSDHWFNFDKGNYAQVADAVLQFLPGQGEKWWKAAGPPYGPSDLNKNNESGPGID